MPGAWYNALRKLNKIFSQRQQVPLCWCNVQNFERLPRLKQSECFSTFQMAFSSALEGFIFFTTHKAENCAKQFI